MRGSGGEVIICEEMAHITPALFFDVILPTFITGPAFIGITTVMNSQNYVSMLLQLKDTLNPKKPLINQIIFEDVCATCKRKGLEKLCNHKKGEKPWWQDPKRDADIQLMAQDHEDSYLRETKGLIVDSNCTPFFARSIIDDFANSSVDIKFDVKHVFVAYDPSCGGKKSDTAIVSIIVIPDNGRGFRSVVVASDYRHVIDPLSGPKLLVKHITELQTKTPFKKSIFVVIPESNLGFEGVWAAYGVRSIQIPNVVIMAEDHNRVGIRVDNSIKNTMIEGLENTLSRHRCDFWSDFQSLNENGVNATKEKMIQELRNFSRKIKYPNDNDLPPKIIYGGKQGYGFDDLVITLSISLFMVSVFFANPKYQRYH